MKRLVTAIVGLCMVIAGAGTAWDGEPQAPTPPAGQAAAPAQPAARAPLPESIPVPRKKVLILAFANGFHHASITNAAATIWTIGNQSGIFESEIRTDTKWITKGSAGGGESRNLDYFDAIVAVNTTGNWNLSDEQKKEFISFIRDEGKGFVGVHAALDAHRSGIWPEYTEMIGGEFAAHPWNHFPAPVIVEDREFPATRHFAANRLVLFDEMYMPKMETFSRSKVNVLMRLDENKLGRAAQRLGRGWTGAAAVTGRPRPRPRRAAVGPRLRDHLGQDLRQGPGVLLQPRPHQGIVDRPRRHQDVPRGYQVGSWTDGGIDGVAPEGAVDARVQAAAPSTSRLATMTGAAPITTP